MRDLEVTRTYVDGDGQQRVCLRWYADYAAKTQLLAVVDTWQASNDADDQRAP